MASATSWSEEDFSCSICLDVFNSPVSTPCGHNFCRTCITTFWDDQVQHKCPVCNALFHTRPDLQVNTFISGMVDRFRSYVLVKEPPCVDVGEVLCDICTGPQLKALKSCLMCFMSYCQTHMEPHQRVARLKTHLLVNAMDRLEDRMCKKHNRLLELFCQTEQVCVCLFCTEGLHRSHPVVPLKEEYEVKTAQLGKIEAEVQHMIQERQRKIQEIKDTVDCIKADADRELADGVKVLTALKCSVEKYQDDLNQTVKEKLKSTEKEAEGLIEELEQEIADLTNRRSEVKQLSHTEDHLHLIQTFRSLKDPPPTRDWTTVEVLPPSYVGTLRRSLEQLEATLNMEMKKLPDLKPDGKKSSRHGHEHGRAAPPPAGEGATQDHQQHVPGRGRAAEQGGADLEADVKKATRASGGEPEEAAGEVEDPEHLKTQELFNRLRSVLNKLTRQMFQPLMKQVMELQIDTEERLNGVTGLIFEKAISEPNFSVVYANMCRCLMGLKVPTTDNHWQTVNFRKLMLNRCQEEFEKDNDNDEFFEKKQKELEAASEGEKQKLKDTLEEVKDEAHRRRLGNIKFIGELFNLKMLTEAIMHHCIATLLKKHDEESRESLCWLLSNIGKELDHRKAKLLMDQYFNMMEKIIEERKTTSRIRFMLQDMLDLRRNLWVPRRVKQGPKTIDQIHKDAELEENREQMKVQRAILSKSSGGDRMGGRGGRGEEEEEDEWEEGEGEEEEEGYAF